MNTNKHLRRVCLVASTCAVLFAAGAGRAAITVVQSSAGGHVAFEADTVATVIAGTPESWVSTNDAAASGGTALYAGGTNNTGTSPHSFAQYSIKFAMPATYYLYYRWKADAARTGGDVFTANSSQIANQFGAYSTPGDLTPFHQSASNGSQAPTNNTFYWQMEADPNFYAVSQADVDALTPLVFTLGTREAGMVIDRFIFSTNNALTQAQLDATSNSETDRVIQGIADSFVAFEADGAAGKIIAGTPESWVSTNDATASGGTALYAGGTNNTGTSPHSFAQYSIKFAMPATYYLYYRWKADAARTGGDVFTANSSQIASQFGAYSTPGDLTPFHQSASNGSQAPTNNTYYWQMEADPNFYAVNQTDVDALTPLVFTLGTREAGMVIDRFIFSTNNALTQAQLDATPNSGSQASGLQVTKAVGSASLTKVSVSFNKPLAPTSVQFTDFIVNGGVLVTAAAVDADDSRRVNLTTSAQAQGTNYTVTVNGITDETGAAIPLNSTASFTAWKIVAGWVTREVYLGIPGAFVTDLVTAPKYPDNPDQVTWSKTFELNNEPLLSQYGARLSAFLTPAVNGAHELFLNNDDEAEILLSTDQSSANLQSLGVFPLNAPPFDTAGFVTSPALTANQRYLLVGLVKQDGGDVYIQIGARPPGSAQAPETLPVLSGNLISTFINPDIGNVTFKQQPTNVTAAAGSRARFAVKVETEESPVYFQWRSGGTNIPGAIRSAYVTPVLTTGDSGKTYDVVVSVAGKDTTSASATLSVVAGQPSNLQPYLGINFVGGGGGGPGGPMSAVDVAGVVLQENWNNLAGFAFDPATTPITLFDANGANTPVTLTLAATESWYSGTLASGDANGALLQGFVDTGAVTDPMVVTLNGVPPGTYHVIVYSLGFDFSASYEQQFSVMGDGVHPSYHGKAETGLTYLQNPGFRRMLSTNPATPDAGNYAQFDNVSPATDGSLAILVTWESTNAGNGHQPAVNAIQLVKVNPVTAVPSLGATIGSPGSLTLSWPAAAAGFTLESSATLGTGASWSAVAGAPNPIATAGSFNVNTTGNHSFYRLRK